MCRRPFLKRTFVQSRCIHPGYGLKTNVKTFVYLKPNCWALAMKYEKKTRILGSKVILIKELILYMDTEETKKRREEVIILVMFSVTI